MDLVLTDAQVADIRAGVSETGGVVLALTDAQVAAVNGGQGLPASFHSVTLTHTDTHAPSPMQGQRWELKLHGSGGAQLIYGDQYDVVCDATLGHVDGQVHHFAAQNVGTTAAPVFQLQPVDRVLLTRPGYLTGTYMETLWRGYSVNLTDKVAHPYTEKFIDDLIAWSDVKYPQTSRTERTASGGSMGGWGMMTCCLRRPQKFAAIFASRPRWRDLTYADWTTGFAKAQATAVMADDGQTVAQRQDHVAYVANAAHAIPFIVMALGRTDGFASFTDYIDGINALKATGRGFAAYWNTGGHSDSAIDNMTPLASYSPAMFELGVGYPVLSGCSADNDPAVDQVGGINLGFAWRNVQESATSWSCELTNAAAVTVNVAPHSAVFPGAAPQSVTIGAGQWVTVSFTATAAPGSVPTPPAPGPTPTPTPDPAPPIDPTPPTALTINRTPLDLASITCLNQQYTSSRYERYQNHTVLTADAISLKFRCTNIAVGGTRLAFPYPKYGLLFDGVERATYTRVGSELEGTFTGALGDEADGPVLTQIVAYDTSGNRVTSPTGSLLAHWLWIDRRGEAKNRADVIFQTGSYEWTHIAAVYAWARVPKTMLGNITKPLPSRIPVPFSTALPAKSIARVDRVPMQVGETHYPCVTSRGITVAENMQAYFNADMTAAVANRRLPLLDGVRGACSASMITFLRFGRNRKLYGCDPFAFWLIDETGTKTTLAGLRDAVAPLWSDTKKTPEIVGNWDASIPASERFPWESWGQCWDLRTLALDMNAAPVGGEQPHVGIGPVAFLSDRHGYVLKLQFNGGGPAALASFGNTDRWAPPIVTRFLAANDPWGLDYLDGVIYVAERGLHRISKYSADSGAYIGDVVSNPNGAALCTLLAGTHEYKRPAGATQAQYDAATVVAPELIEIQDGYLYYGSVVMQEVKRINLATGVIEIVCRPTFNANSHFCYLALSDGTFGPRGTVFVTSYSNQNFGRAEAFLPTPGTTADGTPLTHAVKWNWQANAPGVVRGSGPTDAAEYAIAVAVKDGMLAQGNSNMGLQTFMQADTALDPVPDLVRAKSGQAYFNAQCYPLIFGPYGYGPTLYPLPLGENADCDYWLGLNGH